MSSSFPSADFRFGGYILATPTIASLRNMPSSSSRSKGDTIIVNGALEAGDGSGGIYAWIPGSLDDDDGQTTIKPFDLPENVPGRWRFSIKSNSTEIDGVSTELNNGLTSLHASITEESNLRLTGDSANASRITTLEAGYTNQSGQISGLQTAVTTANAHITDEATARAAADGALATRATNLEASFSTQSGQIGTINSTLTNVQASATTEATARANADSALATRATNLEANYSTLNSGLTTTNASVSSEATARANADSALATRATSLEASYSTQSGQISTINTNIGTLTTAKTNLENNVSALQSSVGALQTNDTSLQNQITSTNASVSSESTARANADSAMATRLTSLEAGSTGGTAALSARIDSEATARTNADTALASRATNLETSVNGGSGLLARVSTTEGAISTLNGKAAAYWQVDAVAGSGRAQLKIHADANGGGGVDIIGDVSINGNLTVDGTLTTAKLANYAITNGDAVSVSAAPQGKGGVSVSTTGYTVADATSYDDGYGGTVSYGGWTTLCTYTLTLANPARVKLIAGVKQNKYGAEGTGTAWATRLRNGGDILDVAWGQASQDKVVLIGYRTYAAGTYTFIFDWAAQTAVSCLNPLLTIDWSFK